MCVCIYIYIYIYIYSTSTYTYIYIYIYICSAMCTLMAFGPIMVHSAFARNPTAHAASVQTKNLDLQRV